MERMVELLLQLFLGLFLLSLAVCILQKLYLFPLALYRVVVEFLPAWRAGHPILHLGIMGLLLLLPAIYWVQRFIRWRQEERLARGAVLARARHLTLRELQEMCGK